MKLFDKLLLFTILISTMFITSSCEVVGDIFKAGIWMGIIAVVVVVALLVWIVRKMF